jgi:FixJ family two-component response regulator
VTERRRSPRDEEPTGEPVVLVVDDDKSMLEALERLLRSVGLKVRVFGSAAELMSSALPDVPSCLVLDVRLPEVSGLDFQANLAAAGDRIPIIFMTGHGDIPMTVQAMKAGAVDFLTKPFRPQEMLDAVSKAITADRKRRADQRIAAELGVSEVTIKIHRLHVMRKMRARSLAELVRIADVLGIHPGKSGTG